VTTHPEPNEFLRGPKWRTRTTARRRHRAAAATFGAIVMVGLVPLCGSGWVLDRLGAPLWLVTAAWWVPMVGVAAWTLGWPTPAAVTDDDDDSWPGYSIRWALVGEDEARPVPVRLTAVAVFGAPVGWSVALSGIATVTGLL
jgi:hypothetical protein